MPPIDPDTFSWGIPGYHGQSFNASMPHTGGQKQFVLPGGPPGAVKKASKARAAARAKRAAEAELKRKRPVGDPLNGQDAEFSIGSVPKFKVPASIKLGKSVHHDSLKDWVKSLMQASKFEVQFGCDWKAAANKRQTSFHCFRHNMSHNGGGYGLIISDPVPATGQTYHVNSASPSGWNTMIPEADQDVAGNTMNASWPNWMGDYAEFNVAGHASQYWPNEAGGTYFVDPGNFMLKPSNFEMTNVSNVQQERITTAGNLPGGYANGIVVKQTVQTPFIPQVSNMVYYAPVNLSDLEDESWYNNRIINKSTMTEPLSNYLAGLNALRTQAHRSRSLIAQQNIEMGATSGAALDRFSQFFGPNELSDFEDKLKDTAAARTQYKAVLKGGNVNYKFINKGDGPAKVDIIIWKYKSTHIAPAPYTFGKMDASAGDVNANTDNRYYTQFFNVGASAAPLPPAGPPTETCNAINDLLTRYSEAYMRQCTAQFGTDAMGGRVPVGVTVDATTGSVTNLDCDIINDPHFPLFKKYSKYFQEGLCDFSEHSRYSYSLDAGQRQEVDVALPGEHYNPCKVQQNPNPNVALGARAGTLPGQCTASAANNQGFSTSFENQAPIAPYNKFTYFIMVSVSGANMNATFERAQNGQAWSTSDGNPTPIWEPAATDLLTTPSSVEAGTAYSGAHVQAYCRYTERMGACSAKETKGPLYNNGAISAPVLSATTPNWAVNTMDLVIGPKLDMAQTVRLPRTRTFNKRPIPNANNAGAATHLTGGPSEVDHSSGDRAESAQGTMEL